MKLAEALLLRADTQKRLASLAARAQRYAFVQEGESPAEDPTALLREADAVAAELARLVTAINRTNLSATLASGGSVTEALAARDALKARHAAVSGVIDAASRSPERHGVKEIRWVATIDVAALQKRADDLAKELRELNAQVQEAGWRVELIES